MMTAKRNRKAMTLKPVSLRSTKCGSAIHSIGMPPPLQDGLITYETVLQRRRHADGMDRRTALGRPQGNRLQGHGLPVPLRGHHVPGQAPPLGEGRTLSLV